MSQMSKMKKRLKINGIIMFLAAVVVVAFPTVFFRIESFNKWDRFAEIFGVAFILLGQLIRVSARGYKAENSKEGLALITGGPYSLVRNPMYLGILLIGLGVVLMLFEWWIVIVFLVIFIIRYLSLIFKEEKKLMILFPKDYLIYCKKVTHRIRPSMRDLLERDVSEYLPLKIVWFKKEIGSILAVLLITLLVESWEDIRGMGIRFYLREVTGIFVIILLFVGLVWYLSLRKPRSEEYAADKR